MAIFGYVLLQKSNRIFHYTINVIKTQFIYDFVLTSGIGHSEFTPVKRTKFYSNCGDQSCYPWPILKLLSHKTFFLVFRFFWQKWQKLITTWNLQTYTFSWFFRLIYKILRLNILFLLTHCSCFVFLSNNFSITHYRTPHFSHFYDTRFEITTMLKHK